MKKPTIKGCWSTGEMYDIISHFSEWIDTNIKRNVIDNPKDQFVIIEARTMLKYVLAERYDKEKVRGKALEKKIAEFLHCPNTPSGTSSSISDEEVFEENA